MREFQLAILRQLTAGQQHLAQVCRENGLADSVLARWRREYAERGEAAFTPQGGNQAPSAFNATWPRSKRPKKLASILAGPVPGGTSVEM
ncbi:MAG: transposase [Nitrososphaerota archaeon]